MASAGASIALGGNGNTCSGSYQGFAAGYQSTSTSYNTYALGYGGSASRIGQFAFGGSIFTSGIGSFAYQQKCWMQLGGKTTNNTPLTLLATRAENTGGTGRCTITSGTVQTALFKLVGALSDGTAVWSAWRQATIKNVGGTTTLIGTVNTVGVDYVTDNATISVAITADDTNDAWQVAVTGPVSGTWRFICDIDFDEFPYGT